MAAGANFLGDDRTASSAAVTERLTELAKSWESFDWQGVQLLISAGKVDKRKSFLKTVKKFAALEDKTVSEKAERGGRAAMVAAFVIGQEDFAACGGRIDPAGRCEPPAVAHGIGQASRLRW